MEEEISLEEVFKIIRKKIKFIIFWSLLGISIASIYTFFIVTPVYESSSRIVVNQTQNTNQTLTNTDIQTNLNLINTYQSIIEEPIILEDVLTATNSKLSLTELKNKLVVQTEANSLVFGISISDENPYIAADLANEIAKSFEQKIGNILEVQSVTILSEAIPNINAVSPNILLNLIYGLIIGVVFGVGLAFLTEMTNKTVKDEKFIESLNWTNLGSIIEMSNEEIKNTRIKINDQSRQAGNKTSRRRIQ